MSNNIKLANEVALLMNGQPLLLVFVFMSNIKQKNIFPIQSSIVKQMQTGVCSNGKNILCAI